MVRRRGYAICTQPRSGSNLIGAILRIGATPNGVEPLRIVYERFLEDRLNHVRHIAALMAVENAVIDERRIDLAVQRDALTDERRQRFRLENGDPNVLDDLSARWLSLIRKVCFRFGCWPAQTSALDSPPARWVGKR